jgi:excisionase family DNA binding protein
MQTPPEVGKRLGVNAEKVLGWIRSGELRAVDVSIHHGSGRPRWRISEADLEDFLHARSATPAPKTRRRRSMVGNVKEYF